MRKHYMITKKQIFDLITEYHKSNLPKEFIPGKSKIHYSGPTYDEKELIAVTDTILDFWLSLGKKGEQFENNFSNYLDVKNTILTNSGSSANLLAIASLKLPPGSEVITPALTFPTTFNPILQNNLVPVLIDVNLTTYNLNPNNLEACLSPITKLIMLPHTLGNPNNMDIITEFAKEHNLYLIEDNCDGLGAKYNNKNLGTFGDLATFSYFPAHHLTMGEGGAVITNNNGLASTVRSLRDWGRSCTCPVCKMILDENYKCPRDMLIKHPPFLSTTTSVMYILISVII